MVYHCCLVYYDITDLLPCTVPPKFNFQINFQIRFEGITYKAKNTIGPGIYIFVIGDTHNNRNHLRGHIINLGTSTMKFWLICLILHKSYDISSNWMPLTFIYLSMLEGIEIEEFKYILVSQNPQLA